MVTAGDTAVMDERPPAGALVSDAERERAVIALRDAAVDGRLTLDEFSERVEHTELARTADDLTAVLAGLPAAHLRAADAPARHSAIFSRLARGGRWGLAADSRALCIGATIDLDLGQATLTAAQSTLKVRNWFGTVTILVPRGVHVTVDGGGAFGTREIELPDAGPVPDAPRLRIHTSGLGGTVRIRSASTPAQGVDRLA
jgi:uncharacterized protein DUF1707/cell wall-active antibiotic response 4TMS protein YvqF